MFFLGESRSGDIVWPHISHAGRLSVPSPFPSVLPLRPPSPTWGRVLMAPNLRRDLRDLPNIHALSGGAPSFPLGPGGGDRLSLLQPKPGKSLFGYMGLHLPATFHRGAGKDGVMPTVSIRRRGGWWEVEDTGNSLRYPTPRKAEGSYPRIFWPFLTCYAQSGGVGEFLIAWKRSC